MRAVIGFVVAFVLLMVVASGFGQDNDGVEEPPPPPARVEDAADGQEDGTDLAAENACTHWANIARDWTDGILTDGEFRTKLQEVHEDARHAEDVRIGEQSATLLRVVTEGKPDATVMLAADVFSKTCLDEVLDPPS